ncbi:MAG: sulfotransferase domain-containing protein, partial [Cyanobacteria bacterium P01_D01_bin.56]
MSPIKEPGFFDFEGTPPNFQGPGDQELYSSVVTTLEDYSELFSQTSGEIALGEATTWYLYSKQAPKRIKYYIPDAKLIVLLRNPVERAYSGFMHAVRDKREFLDFAEALVAEDQRIANNWEYIWRYQQIGFYGEQLERYFTEFSQEQIRVYLYEDLCDDPDSLLRDIFQFLGVDENHTPEVFTRLNISGKKRSGLIDELLKDTNPIKKIGKLFLPSQIRKKIADNVRAFNYVKSECSLEVRLKLLHLYKEDIMKVQDLIGRDLSSWLSA